MVKNLFKGSGVKRKGGTRGGGGAEEAAGTAGGGGSQVGRGRNISWGGREKYKL